LNSAFATPVVRLSERLERFFFGHDIFISYGRSDASQYALALASRLTTFACYLDQFGTEPGETLPKAVQNIVRKSTVFVLIESRGSAASKSVQEEVKLFRSTGRPVIPIDVDGTSKSRSWMRDLRGLPVACETTSCWEKGLPSDQIVTRIEQSFTYTRRSQRLRRSVLASVAFVVVSILGSVWSVASIARTAAKSQAIAAEAQQEAKLNKSHAAEANRQAQAAAIEARQQQAIADERANTAKDRLIDLDQEHGRLELVAGNPIRALPYLVNAYAGRPHDEALGFLLARAVKSVPTSISLKSNGLLDPIAHLTRDGHAILTVDSRGVRLWDAFTADLVSSVNPIREPIHVLGLPGFTAAASTHHGELITAGTEPVIDFWDLASGDHLRSIQSGLKNSIMSLELSQNDERMVITTVDGTVQIVNVAEPATVADLGLKISGDQVNVAVSPNGETSLASFVDRLELWDNRSKHVLSQLLAGNAQFSTLGVFDGTSSVAAVGKNDGTVTIWNPEKREAFELPALHMASVTGLMYLSDGRLLSAGADGVVNLVSGSKYDVVHRLESVNCSLKFISASIDMRRIAALCGKHAVAVWEIATGALLNLVDLSEFTSPAKSLELNGDGSQFLVANTDEARMYWSALGNGIHSIHRKEFLVAGIDQTSKEVVGITSDGMIARRKIDTGSEQKVLSLGGDAFKPLSARLSGDGHTVVADGDDDKVHVLNTESGHSLGTFTPLPGTARPPCSDVTPDGSYASICGAAKWDGGQKNPAVDWQISPPVLWNLRTNELARLPLGSQCIPSRFRYSEPPITIRTEFVPDGKYLAVSCTLRTDLWDVVNKRLVMFIPSDQFAVSADGQLMAEKPRSRTDQDRDGDDVSIDAQESHGRWFAALPGSDPDDLERDEEDAPSVSHNDDILILEVSTGREVRKLAGVLGNVSSIRFSPDRRYVIAGTHSGILQVWTTDTAQLAHTLVSEIGEVLDIHFSHRDKRF
jgi:WD40 repeat protein